MTLRFALLTALFLTAVLGCDSSGDDLGVFDAALSGAVSTTLTGRAAFATDSEDGHLVTAIGLIDRRDPQDLIVLVLPERAREGDFAIRDEQAGGIVVLTSGEEGDVYVAHAGTVTITRATGDRVAGRFRAEGIHLLDPKKRVTVSGTFDAEPGDVDTGDVDSDA